MSLDAEIRADLQSVGNDKIKLMKKYNERQQILVKEYGGNLTDIPIDDEHEFHVIQRKIRFLHNMVV